MGIVPNRQDQILPRYSASAGLASPLPSQLFGSEASVPKQTLRHYTSAQSFSALESIPALVDSNFCYGVFELNRIKSPRASVPKLDPRHNPSALPVPVSLPLSLAAPALAQIPPVSALVLVGHFFALAACSAHGSSRCTSFPTHSSNLGRDMPDQLVGHSLSRTS